MSKDLSTLSNVELVELYRAIGGEIKAGKFRTKAEGIARIQEIQVRDAGTVQAEIREASADTVRLECFNVIRTDTGEVVETLPASYSPVQPMSKKALRASLTREERKKLKRQVRRTVKAEGRRSKSA